MEKHKFEYSYIDTIDGNRGKIFDVYNVMVDGKCIGWKYYDKYKNYLYFDIFTINPLENVDLIIDGIKFPASEYGYFCHTENELEILHAYIVKHKLNVD